MGRARVREKRIVFIRKEGQTLGKESAIYSDVIAKNGRRNLPRKTEERVVEAWNNSRDWNETLWEAQNLPRKIPNTLFSGTTSNGLGGLMQGQLTYTLILGLAERKQLEETLERYNRACDHIAGWALKNQKFESGEFEKALGKDLQKKDFWLSSGLAKTACQHVSTDFFAIPTRERGSLGRLPAYADNRFVIYNKDTASLKMTEVLPTVHTSKFPVRLSLSISRDKKGETRRPLLRFDVRFDEGADFKAPNMRLVFDEQNERWLFLATVKNADVDKFRLELRDVFEYQGMSTSVPPEDIAEAYAPIPDEDLIPDPAIVDEEIY